MAKLVGFGQEDQSHDTASDGDDPLPCDSMGRRVTSGHVDIDNNLELQCMHFQVPPPVYQHYIRLGNLLPVGI